MSAGVRSSPCSLTDRRFSSAEERLLKDKDEVQLMAFFAKDLCRRCEGSHYCHTGAGQHVRSVVLALDDQWPSPSTAHAKQRVRQSTVVDLNTACKRKHEVQSMCLSYKTIIQNMLTVQKHAQIH